jgi:hypothetical protein
VEDWSDAPPEWVARLDYAAFCRPGEWHFDPFGEFIDVGFADQPKEILAAALFFQTVAEGATNWIKDGPRPDELTTLRISRGDTGELTVQALAGTTLAAWRTFKYATRSGPLWTRSVDVTECEPDRPLLIELDYFVDSWSGGKSVDRASLALAADGSLVVRVDSYSCWLCLMKNRSHDYARFRATDANGRPLPSAN